MSAEFRHIFFNDSELLRIVADNAGRGSGRLPVGRMRGLEILNGEAPQVRGLIDADDGSGAKEFSLGGADLMSAVISFCIAQGTPLPAKATKSLQILAGRLVLVITMNIKDEAIKFS